MLLGDLAHRGGALWPSRHDSPIIQLYTSGTTGRPKGCLLTNRRWGEAVKALVVVRDPAGPEELDAYCRERLGGFKCPRWYEFAEAIPRNHSGKILKRDLRAAHDPAVAVRLPEGR